MIDVPFYNALNGNWSILAIQKMKDVFRTANNNIKESGYGKLNCFQHAKALLAADLISGCNNDYNVTVVQDIRSSICTLKRQNKGVANMQMTKCHSFGLVGYLGYFRVMI